MNIRCCAYHFRALEDSGWVCPNITQSMSASFRAHRYIRNCRCKKHLDQLLTQRNSQKFSSRANSNWLFHEMDLKVLWLFLKCIPVALSLWSLAIQDALHTTSWNNLFYSAHVLNRLKKSSTSLWIHFDVPESLFLKGLPERPDRFRDFFKESTLCSLKLKTYG